MRLPYSVRTRGSALPAAASLITVPERHGYNLRRATSGTDHASAALQQVTNAVLAPSISTGLRFRRG